MTVLGAVAVSGLTALVTAKTTNNRLDKQLAAEKKRVELQLGSEEARQAEKLRHDRELSDLAELRALLDEASRLISKVVKTSAQVSTSWIKRAESEEDRERLEGQRQFLRNETVDIVEVEQRIMLRLARNSDVRLTLGQVRESLARFARISSEDSTKNKEDAKYMADGQGCRDLAAAHIRFLDAARALVGSELPQ